MKSLSKQALLDWREFAARAEHLWEEVMVAHSDYVDAVAAFNTHLVEANAVDMVEAWALDVELYMAERAGPWREGERGQAYEAWHAALSELAYRIVEVDMPEEPEAPDWVTADLPFEPEL